jgi:hypothetical protein
MLSAYSLLRRGIVKALCQANKMTNTVPIDSEDRPQFLSQMIAQIISRMDDMQAKPGRDLSCRTIANAREVVRKTRGGERSRMGDAVCDRFGADVRNANGIVAGNNVHRANTI